METVGEKIRAGEIITAQVSKETKKGLEEGYLRMKKLYPHIDQSYEEFVGMFIERGVELMPVGGRYIK
jgi:hypothetical protein